MPPRRLLLLLHPAPAALCSISKGLLIRSVWCRSSSSSGFRALLAALPASSSTHSSSTSSASSTASQPAVPRAFIPRSRTSPGSMFRSFRQFFSTTPSPQRLAAMASAKETVQKIINGDDAVVVFSKSYCPFCAATKRTLDTLGAEYKVVELDKESDGSAMQDALEDITGQRTVPNVFINKKPIGGNSDLQTKHKSGELKSLLEAAGSLKS